MKIPVLIRKYTLMLLLIAPLTVLAQQDFQLKAAAAAREFWRKDSLRRLALTNDTTQAAIARSPMQIIYMAAQSPVGNNLQLGLQVIRFAQQHTLHFVMCATQMRTVTFGPDAKLAISLDDGSNVLLDLAGSGAPRGNGMRNSSEQEFDFRLEKTFYQLLLSRKVASIRIVYEGGSLMAAISGLGSNSIQQACILIK